jgi:hypothetical protein
MRRNFNRPIAIGIRTYTIALSLPPPETFSAKTNISQIAKSSSDILNQNWHGVRVANGFLPDSSYGFLRTAELRRNESEGLQRLLVDLHDNIQAIPSAISSTNSASQNGTNSNDVIVIVKKKVPNPTRPTTIPPD